MTGTIERLSGLLREKKGQLQGADTGVSGRNRPR